MHTNYLKMLGDPEIMNPLEVFKIWFTPAPTILKKSKVWET